MSVIQNKFDWPKLAVRAGWMLLLMETVYIGVQLAARLDYLRHVDVAWFGQLVILPALLLAVAAWRVSYVRGVIVGLVTVGLCVYLFLFAPKVRFYDSAYPLSIYCFGPGVAAVLSAWLVDRLRLASLCLFALLSLVVVLAVLDVALLGLDVKSVQTLELLLCVVSLLSCTILRLVMGLWRLAWQPTRVTAPPSPPLGPASA